MTGILPKITFHKGSVYEESFVTKTVGYGGALLIIAAETPFHPRDYQWPDQPADKGVAVNSAGSRFSVRDAVFAATDGGAVFADEDIPVKKGEPGWFFCVGHVLDADSGFSEGDKINLAVESGYRRKLSRVHSATHVMSLALNRTLAPLWSKEAPLLDAFGAPCFDSLAIAQSDIGENSCTDRYRLGKSLRKKGFSARELGAALKKCEDEINGLVAEWLAADAPVTILAEEDILAARRSWRAEVAGRPVEIPCGGTHVGALSEIGAVSVMMEMPDEETLVIVTSVK